MMRKVFAFTVVTTAAADLGCQVDASGIVADGLNSALAIWAAEKRCKGQWVTTSPIKCATDVTTSVAAVTHLASSIAGTIKACGQVRFGDSAICGIAADNMVSATAGLAEASEIIADKCAHAAKAPWDGDVLGGSTQLGKCTADMSGSINGIFSVANGMEKLKANCADGHCPITALDAVGLLASLGGSITAAVGDCSQYKNPKYDASEGDCAGAIMGAVSQLSATVDQTKAMQNACNTPARLYSQPAAPSSSMPIMALAAALPVTAVVSFVLGRRFSSRARQQVDMELGNSIE